METLHDRIGKVINTFAFEKSLAGDGIDKIDFQCTWHKESRGDFAKLCPEYQRAILAGEQEIVMGGEMVLVSGATLAS